MSNPHPSENLQLTVLHEGINLWKPDTDLLHNPDIQPQDPGCDEVLLGLPLGECGGVKMANQLIEALNGRSSGQIRGNHEPTHGADSTAEFERLGAQFGMEPNAVPIGMPYVISAHGAPPSVLGSAQERGLDVFDVTCPLVHKTHRAILSARDVEGGRGRVAYISFGSPSHAERIGAAGVAEEAGIPFSVISNEEGVASLLGATEDSETIVVVGQTTNNSDEAEELAAHLHEQAAGRGINVQREQAHDVCHTVRDRQRSTREIVGREVGSLVVVGSVNSKNTKSLALVAAQEAAVQERRLEIYLTNSWGQLPLLAGTVGVVSGASTRGQNVSGVITRLAPNNGTTLVGVDTDKGIVFSPVHKPSRDLLNTYGR